MNHLFYNKLTQEAKLIREEVFIKEQNFIEEFDDIDNIALHIIIYKDNFPIATGRLYESEVSKSFIIGRIAVLKQYRKNNIGSLIMTLLESKAKELGAEKTSLSAQCIARPFYEKLGYVVTGNTYFEEYCEHIKMEKLI